MNNFDAANLVFDEHERRIKQVAAQTSYHITCINDLQEQVHSLKAQVAAIQSGIKVGPIVGAYPTVGGGGGTAKPEPRKTLGEIALEGYTSRAGGYPLPTDWDDAARAVAEAIIERYLDSSKYMGHQWPMKDASAAIRAEFE